MQAVRDGHRLSRSPTSPGTAISVRSPRAAPILQRELDQSTAEDWDLKWHVSAGEIERTTGRTTAHFSLIELHHPRLFELDPSHIREVMEEAATRAVKKRRRRGHATSSSRPTS